MIIYAEYYFLENFLMDYIIIKTTIKILNAYVPRHKVFIGSLLGALYSMVYFSQNLIFLYNMVYKIIFILSIVGIVFTYNSIREYGRILCTFYLVNISLSGSVLLITYFIGINQSTVSFTIIFVLFLTGKVNSRFLSDFHNYIKSLHLFKDMQKDITVKIEEDKINFNALLDTGNLLKDPITKDPVMIVDVKNLENILPKELIYVDYSTMDFKKIDYLLEKLGINMKNRFRVIPYKVVGNEKGLLLGFKADYIELEGNKKGNIILGLSNFSEKKGYNAIVNPNML